MKISITKQLKNAVRSLTLRMGYDIRRVERRLYFERLFDKYHNATCIHRPEFIANLELIQRPVLNPALKHGAMVECGTWKGGMSAAMIEIGGMERDYYFFDSFEGLPEVNEIDGQSAKLWQQDNAHNCHNCRCDLEDFKQTIRLAWPTHDRVSIYKGWFSDTFKKCEPNPLAVLRLDADWYDPTMECLTKFWDHMLPGGIVLIDDYYHWDGCSRAVHDFLSQRSGSERIEQYGGVAFIVKRIAE